MGAAYSGRTGFVVCAAEKKTILCSSFNKLPSFSFSPLFVTQPGQKLSPPSSTTNNFPCSLRRHWLKVAHKDKLCGVESLLLESYFCVEGKSEKGVDSGFFKTVNRK